MSPNAPEVSAIFLDVVDCKEAYVSLAATSAFTAIAKNDIRLDCVVSALCFGVAGRSHCLNVAPVAFPHVGFDGLCVPLVIGAVLLADAVSASAAIALFRRSEDKVCERLDALAL